MPVYYIPKAQFKIVSQDEMRRYIDTAKESDTRAILALAWLTGARVQELLNLSKKDFIIGENTQDGMVIIRALKHGKTGYPSFSFSDPFVDDVIMPYIAELAGEDRLFRRSKRHYQQKLHFLNLKLCPADTSMWITFHYLRHSRLTHLAQVLRAFPEELKSWTGHKSSAYEEYFAPRRIDRFKGRLGSG